MKKPSLFNKEYASLIVYFHAQYICIYIPFFPGFTSLINQYDDDDDVYLDKL
jgi:hypothetical protein